MEEAITLAGPTFGVAWGFLYGVPGRDAPRFMPTLRQLGGGCAKLHLFWSQIEPEKGQFDWHAVDTFLDQLQSPDEALITLFSSSTWATRRQSPVLPPSPASELDDYARFVHALVSHCKGRVRFWQNDSEPNNPIFWDGTPEEFTRQLHVFARAVRKADPRAVVVCGGYDGLFQPTGAHPMPGQERGLAFFDHVLRVGRDDFDVFDIHLYADPYTIPARVEAIRRKMDDLGSRKPILCTEYHGPGLFEFPANFQYGGLAGSWSSAITDDREGQRSARRAQTAQGVGKLYAHMETLAPQTQMFMQGCPPEMEQKLEQLQCHDLVMRNVLALAAGVQKTMYWDLWHDTSKRDDLAMLMFGKHRLTDYADGGFTPRQPLAQAFRQMTAMLAGVTLVRRVPVSAHPTLFVYEALRQDRDLLVIVWDRRDPFAADSPPVKFACPWTALTARARDALGQAVPVHLAGAQAHLDVTDCPIFLEPGEQLT